MGPPGKLHLLLSPSTKKSKYLEIHNPPALSFFSPFTRLFLVLFIHHQRKQKQTQRTNKQTKTSDAFFSLKKKKSGKRIK